LLRPPGQSPTGCRGVPADAAPVAKVTRGTMANRSSASLREVASTRLDACGARRWLRAREGNAARQPRTSLTSSMPTSPRCSRQNRPSRRSRAREQSARGAIAGSSLGRRERLRHVETRALAGSADMDGRLSSGHAAAAGGGDRGAFGGRGGAAGCATRGLGAGRPKVRRGRGIVRSPGSHRRPR
jgi:hypothetical protein